MATAQQVQSTIDARQTNLDRHQAIITKANERVARGVMSQADASKLIAEEQAAISELTTMIAASKSELANIQAAAPLVNPVAPTPPTESTIQPPATTVEPANPAFNQPESPAPDPNTGGVSDTAASVVDGPNFDPAAQGPGGYDPAMGDDIYTAGGYVPGADETAADTAEKYADPNNIGPDFTVKEQAGGYDAAMGDDIYTGGGYDPDQSYTDPNDLSSMPADLIPAEPVINGTPDTRVKLLVPMSYLSGNTTGPKNQLKLARGIIFPYTPTISLEHKANYSGVNTPHSNYTQYFYKNSAVSEINIGAKFTVQNEDEAGLYIAVVHLLRVLTKMQFGNDKNAGSPPPICRLLAFGDYMLNNVPVAVTSFKADFPDNVDYFRTGDTVKDFGYTSVPVLSTISLTLIPMYSRSEMLRGTVTGWIDGNQRVRGYL